jgi:hypothetical protein
MIDFRPGLIAASLLALAACILPAHAQLARTYVSSFGNDANNCDRPTPCRTFQRAHDNTLASGEITVLDPGGYGAVAINRTISIINDGVGEAGVLVSGGAIGITINAGPGDRVSLRGLTIKGIAFGGSNGIRYNTGASVTVENCAVRNHSGDGIQMLGHMTGATQTFTLSNTFVADNGGNGIFMQPTGGGVLSVVLSRVEMYNNNAHGFGFITAAGVAIEGTVLDSVAANNAFSGFSIVGANGVPARMWIARSAALANAGRGAVVDNAFLFLSQNVMVANVVEDWGGINGGQVTSYGDNVGNGTTNFTTTKH